MSANYDLSWNGGTRTEEHGKTPEKGPGPCTMGRPALPCPRSGFMFCWIAGSTCVEEGKTADRNVRYRITIHR